MVKRFKDSKSVIKSRKGMTLTEVLVAMTLLVIIIFVFTPAFLSYFKNIRTAGEITKQTYERASIMERLVANKNGINDVGYETDVAAVPISLKSSDACVLDFSTNQIEDVRGVLVSENLGRGDSYVTFYTEGASNTMVCFPASLTDDFLTKDIRVVPKGFSFASEAFSKTQVGGYHFEVYNTNSSGVQTKVPNTYYEITKEEDDGDGKNADIAKFTFKGANNVISFENSPLYIKYYKNSVMLYEVEIEIGAPEIIMVGEKASDGNYYYYVTKGVDPKTGKMEILAKKMTGDNALKSAMNDVEWVPKGRGDDGNGGVNQYGYFVMGGDAGQVRRFWRNETTGNYYWGGDIINNYSRRYDRCGDATYETFTRELTTQASFKNIYHGDSGTGYLNASDYSVLVEAEKDKLGHKYQAVVMNSFTANATDVFYLTVGGVGKHKKPLVGGSNWNAYPYNSDMDRSDYDNLIAWYNPNELAGLSGIQTMADAYKAATNYEYEDDQSLITITSVGAIQINTGNSNYSRVQANSKQGSSNVYPEQSYTLYCGYIPAVTDVYGWKTSNAGGWSKYVYMGTLGVACSSGRSAWYPTGKFGDIYTTSNNSIQSAGTLNKNIFGTNPTYIALLNYYDDKHDNSAFTAPSSKNSTNWYKAKEGGRIGQILTGQGQDYYLTGKHEVDITVGYLSEPYAICVDNPTAPSVKGANSAANYYHTFNGVGKFGHSYTSAGLRDNVTMLDVKSYHDDITGNNVSLAVGYSLSYLCNDYYWATRIGQVYNTGIVYIRATGDGTENDTQNSMASGKGWSLKKESNVFHQFYGIDQYQDGQPNGRTGKSALGWDTYWHRAYFNVSSNSDKAPQSGYSPNIDGYNDSYGTSCHPLADTKCTTCNWGTTGDGKPQAMWGTENGTLMSWFYDQENVVNSKITSVTKEFESYTWMRKIGSSGNTEFYDYPSRAAGISNNFGFVSTLTSINDVACADDVWVAVGNQSLDGSISPANICAGGGTIDGVNWKPYSGYGEHASYINVKYCVDRTNNIYLWKAIKICDYDTVNIIQVSYNQGVWYALGYIDANKNGKNDADENAVMYYSTNPTYEWYFCKTKTAVNSETYINQGGSSMFNSGSSAGMATAALTFDESTGEFKTVAVTGINSGASQG